MTKETRVDQNLVGIGNPCFVIAEAGVNHNGDLEKAIELASLAHRAGADAVKFQLFNIEEQVSKFAESAPYQRKGAGQKTMTEMASSIWALGNLRYVQEPMVAIRCPQSIKISILWLKLMRVPSTPLLALFCQASL